MPTTSVAIPDAARILGVSEHTIRRRLKRGELAGERVDRPQGYEWRVLLGEDLASHAGQPNANGDDDRLATDNVDGHLNGHVNIAAGSQIDLGAVLELAKRFADELAAMRAELREERARSVSLVAERDRRIAELGESRFQLAGQLGFYQAQLEAAREQIKLLEAPKPHPEGVPSPAPRRRWWQFWRGVTPSTGRA